MNDPVGIAWNSLLTVGLFLLGLFHNARRDEARDMKTEIENVSSELRKHELETAKNYATKSEVDRLSDKIDERFDRVDRTLDEMKDRLPSKPPTQH